MTIFKYVFYFILFFALFYSENYKITENLTFSQVWKIPLVLVMIWYVFRRRNLSRPVFNKAAYFIGLKNIVNQGLLKNPVTNIVETFRFANFPLLYDTINIYFKDHEKLQKFIVRISQYFILSSIPFLLGFLESVKKGIIIGDKFSFIGVFQNPHGASVVLCLSVLVLFHHIKTNKLTFAMRLFNIILILLGLYCLYLAFVRTGYLMFVIGFIILFFPSKISLRQLALFIVLASSLGAIFFYLIETNEIFLHRLFDQSKEGIQMNAGSGRLIFAKTSLKYWSEGNMFQLVLGRGLDDVQDNLEKTTGMRIGSHNGFVDALAKNGIVGLSLLIIFLFYMYMNIRRNNGTNNFRLSLAMFFCYVSFQLTQGGVGFPLDLFMTSIVNLINKEYTDSNNYSTMNKQNHNKKII